MLNKVMLIGRLGKDPERRATPNGTVVCKFSIATDESYKGRDGQKVEKTEWHNIVAWGKLAEVCAEYLKKGKLVFIEGSISTQSWDDKETGQKKSRTEINCQNMKMLDRKSDDDEGQRYSTEKGRSQRAATAPIEQDDEEVPF